MGDRILCYHAGQRTDFGCDIKSFLSFAALFGIILILPYGYQEDSNACE